MTRAHRWIVAVALAAACGHDDGARSGAEAEAEAESESESDSEVVGVAASAGASIRLPLDPGDEDTWCVEVRLDNDQPLDVHRIAATLSPQSHHMIVYRSRATVEVTAPFHCTPFVGAFTGESVPVLITQVARDEVVLPDRVAYAFEPHQMVRLEMHAINTTAEAADAVGAVTFEGLVGGVPDAYADLLFYGALDIDVPPGETGSAGPAFLPVDAGTRVFALTGHTHRFGTNVSIRKAESILDEGAEVYAHDDWDWEEPPSDTFDPPLEFAEGGGFRIRCDYENTGTESVGVGESANDEMCFLWAYYWPSMGYQACVAYDSLSICCPDDPLCDVIADFF
ncbi:MAG: hypothetical protein AABZ30_06500 [Myxococcota bacterium]